MSTENTFVDIEGEFSSMFNKRICVTDNNHNFLRSRFDDLNDKMNKLLRRVDKVEQSKDVQDTKMDGVSKTSQKYQERNPTIKIKTNRPKLVFKNGSPQFCVALRPLRRGYM